MLRRVLEVTLHSFSVSQRAGSTPRLGKLTPHAGCSSTIIGSLEQLRLTELCAFQSDFTVVCVIRLSVERTYSIDLDTYLSSYHLLN